MSPSDEKQPFQLDGDDCDDVSSHCSSEFEAVTEQDSATDDTKKKNRAGESSSSSADDDSLAKGERIEKEYTSDTTTTTAAITKDEGTTNSSSSATAYAMARKAGVAVSGVALTGIGLVMIPLPTPFGCLVAASGMAVLGTEFPAAQKVLDQTRDSVVRTLEQNCGSSSDEEQDNDDDDFVVVEKPMASEDKWIPAVSGLKKAGKKLGRKALPILKSLGSSTLPTNEEELIEEGAATT